MKHWLELEHVLLGLSIEAVTALNYGLQVICQAPCCEMLSHNGIVGEYCSIQCRDRQNSAIRSAQLLGGSRVIPFVLGSRV